VARLAAGPCDRGLKAVIFTKRFNPDIILVATPLPEKGLMYCIARDVTKRKRMKLIRSYQDQLSLITAVVDRREGERRKIAVELHDNIGQILALAESQTGKLKNKLKPISETISEEITAFWTKASNMGS
jgi:signal transduction histidine kinase